MAPLPKRRMSSARSGKRRSQIKLNTVALIECSSCKALKLPHTTCPTCGTYRGKTIKAPKSKVKVTKLTKS
ncbi:MAG: 50S ribosomal protein L32 [Patescibacteria group bacterium]|nr:50S ribosomal protein L32 [Patescibacteria group bacterium]